MDELYHHGIIGQKWGVRRYQNADGTLTAAGRKRQTAGSIRRGLNNNDQNWTFARTKQKKIEKKLYKRGFEKYADGSDEVIVPNRYTGSDKKAEKLVKKYNALDKEMKRLDRNTWSLLAAAREKKFDVTSKPIQRVADKGRLYATTFLVGLPVAGLITPKTLGTGYEVRKKGTGRISLTV